MNWRNKRVIITGGASFIGSHLCEHLIQRNVKDIIVLDDLSAGKFEHVPKDVELKVIDLRDYNLAKQYIKGDVCFHLASVHGGRGYVSGHDVEISDNFTLSGNVFRACANNNISNVAFSSSACAYDTRKQQNEYDDFKIPETWDLHKTELYPDGMYGLEKAVSERVLLAYHKANLFKATVCRFFTVFGERMNPTHFICASIAKSFIKQNPYYVWGGKDVLRNFTYVYNTVEGLIKSTERGNGEIYNIGSEDRITIESALETIWNKMEWRPKDIVYQPEKPVGVRNRIANSFKAQTELDWNIDISFDEGLDKTIDWFVQNNKIEDVRNKLEKELTER